MADKKPDKDLSDKVKDALGTLTLGNQKKQQKDKYAFWGTQPVVQFSEASTSEVGEVLVAMTMLRISTYDCSQEAPGAL